MTMKKVDIIAKYGIEDGTRRIEKLKAQQRAYRSANREKQNSYSKSYYDSHKQQMLDYHKGYYAKHREELIAKQKAYNDEHDKEQKAYRKRHFKENGYANQKKSQAKRTDNDGTQIEYVALKACCRFFGMQCKEFMAFRKSIGYTFHHAFGNDRPSDGIFLPKEAHDALHSIYGRKNENVPFERCVEFCRANGYHFYIIVNTPLLV